MLRLLLGGPLFSRMPYIFFQAYVCPSAPQLMCVMEYL